jgi:hypothetical protein
MRFRNIFRVNKSKINDLKDSNILSLRKNGPIFEIHSDAVSDFWNLHHRAVISVAVPLVVIIVVAVGFSSRGAVAKFSPSDCLGGWYNTDGAEGKPDLDEKSKITEFTEENSAYLTKGKSGSVFCSSFSGETPADKYPKSFDLKISWAINDGSIYQKTESSESVEEALEFEEEAQVEIEESVDENVSNEEPVAEETPVINEVTTEEIPAEVVPEETAPEAPEEEAPVETTPEPEPEPTPEPDPEPEPTPEPDAGIDGMGIRKIFEKIVFAFDAREVFAEGEEAPVETTPEPEPEPTPEPDPEPEIVAETNPEPEVVTDPTPESEVTPVEETEEVVVEENIPVEQEGANDPVLEEINAETQSENETVAEEEKDKKNKDEDVEEDDSVSDEPLYEVFINTGGEEWVSVGTVGYDNWKNYTISLPIYSWQDVANLQIEIRSLPTLDALPVVYLDGMVLEVTYDDMISVPDYSPDFDNDVVSFDKTFEDNIRIIKIIRPTGETEVWMTSMASGSVPLYQNLEEDGYKNLDISTSTEDIIVGTNEILEEEFGIGGEEMDTETEQVAVLVDEEGQELIVSEVIDEEQKITETEEEVVVSEEKTFDTGLESTGAVLEGVLDSVEYNADLFIQGETTFDFMEESNSTSSEEVASSSNSLSIFSKETLIRKSGGMDEKGEPLVWERIVNSDLISTDTPLFYDGGVLFWISKMGESMQIFDTRSKTPSSTTFKSKSGNFEIEYISGGGDVKVASLSIDGIFNVRVGDIQ